MPPLGTNEKRFYFNEAVGMGGDGPWEYIANCRVASRGLTPFPSLETFYSDLTLALTYGHMAKWVFLDGQWKLVVLVSNMSNNPTLYKRVAKLLVLNEAGAVELNAKMTHNLYTSYGEHFEAGDRWGVATLFDNLFFSRGNRLWVLKSGVLGTGYSQSNPFQGFGNVRTVDNGWTLATVQWRPGTASGALPYISGSGCGRILCAHRNRLFMAGWRDGEVIRFDNEMTESQQKLLQLTNTNSVLSPTTIAISSRTIVWSDANDPFAVSLPNFYSVLCKGPIRAMVSWNGMLFIASDKEIWVAEGSMEDESLTFRQVSDGIGVEHAEAMVATPHGVAVACGRDVWLTDGNTMERLSSPIQHLFEQSISMGTTASLGTKAIMPPFEASSFGGLSYNERTQELWVPVRVQSTVPSWSPAVGRECYAALIFNMDAKAWTVWHVPVRSGSLPVGAPDFPIWNVLHHKAASYLVPAWFDEALVIPATGAHVIMRLPEQGIIGTRVEFGTFPITALATPVAMLVTRSMLGDLGYGLKHVGLEATMTKGTGTAYWATEEAQAGLDSGTNTEGEVDSVAFTIPMHTPTTDLAGTGKWGTAKFRGATTSTVFLPVVGRSKSSRVAFVLPRDGGWMFHGLGLVYQVQRSHT